MRRTLIAAGLFLGLSVGALAQDSASPASSDASVVTPGQLAQWLNDLQSDEFQARQQATESLERAGRAAVDALQSLAEGNNIEAAIRSLTVLDRIAESDDKAAADAAQKALETLSTTAQPVVAQRARLALARGKLPGALPAGGLGMQMQVQGQGVQVRVVNGKREIHIKEADREVHFTDDNGKNIRAEVTKTVDGKKKTEKFEAKDIEELRKKQPDLAKLFEQQGNVVQFNVAIAAFQGGNLPQRVMPNAKAAHADIEKALGQLKEMEQRIAKLTPETTAEELKQLQEDLSAIRKELHAAQARLE